MKRKFYSKLYWFLIKFSGYRFKNRLFKSIWGYLWNNSVKNYKGPIDFKLHGEKVILNNGNPYPLFIFTYFKYNFPLIEIVHQTFIKKKSKIDFIDIGAAVGDTMLLLFKNCPNMIHNFFCIDGDDEFHEYQKSNLKKFKNGTLIKAILSDYETKNEKTLLRTHKGTASSQGNENIEAVTLDELLLERYKIRNIDLIKIDVDGLDGKVISGAKKIIQKFNPTLIFEWHPILIEQTKNNISKPFFELTEYGYDKFLFFDKYGNFNHFQSFINEDEINFLSKLCLNGNYHDEWHFDVIALKNNSEINLFHLAELKYSTSN